MIMIVIFGITAKIITTAILPKPLNPYTPKTPKPLHP